ncbi:hypothetical protein TanjilG_00801 [Lupinus angustifolius]|uniref:Adenylyltransferase and sulfurtransferase MOCS3 n=1 Tax=Lupinus angustifolius TaxID=3871 RepID=A0A4P1R870_LUPAN|nr:PREDICTED: adenylyltransferase and sulfurtransferase MOCS3 [Lupinus angustifolius]OIW04241.1 hypothetical protein TanjilG_00801 [Lupinus angustifolius]
MSEIRESDNVCRIMAELQSLKEAKSTIDNKISLLEAELRDLQNDAANNNELSPQMIYRYSRHLLLPNFGVLGQQNLLNSSILVVGAGGLGSPALLYLAACGVGRLGIVDHDIVELNNMHRQIIHTETYIGKPKVKSAASACRSVNSSIRVVEHQEALRTSNALEIFSKYDIIVDATDNAPTRYMISDCCVVLGKPLVSGAALGLEGQLTVYNYNGGPCYRCLFPTPPPTTACQRCADSGVLGVVPGIIGCLQALEAIKIAASVGEPLSGRMLLFDALSARIRIVKIRGRSLQCEACGENSKFTQQQFREFDYENFTQTPLSVSPLKLNLLPSESRISSKEYNEIILKKEPHVLVDVRPAHHFKIVSLPKSLNIPLSTLEARLPEILSALKKEEEDNRGVVSGSSAQLYVVCRRGNDSQRAVQSLQKLGFTYAKDIVGGLESWAHNVDPNFPTY